VIFDRAVTVLWAGLTEGDRPIAGSTQAVGSARLMPPAWMFSANNRAPRTNKDQITIPWDGRGIAMKSRLIEFTTTSACNLVKTGVLLAIAAVALSWAIGAVRIDGTDGSRGVRSSEVSKAAVETNRLVMSVGSGRSCAEYSLEDEEGRELLRVTYGRKGIVVVNLGDSFPIRPGFSAGLDGSYDFVVAHEGMDHRLKIRPGGPSKFTVAARSRRIGDPTFDPWMVGQR